MSTQSPPEPHRPQASRGLPPVILASGSPRRQELLRTIGLAFDIIPSEVDEAAFAIEQLSPADQVIFLAGEKAKAVAEKYPDCLVIGSDTLVAVDSRVLGKPADRDQAFAMLGKLQNREHTVYSAITVIYQGRTEADVLATRVWMKPLSSEEIHRYIDTGEPMDKAGAYAIQGYGSLFVERVEGCYFNVMGMSMALLESLFRRFDLSLL